MIIRIFDYGGAVDIPQHDDEYKTQPNPTEIVLCYSTLAIITVINILVGERNPEFYKSLDAIQKDYALACWDLLASHSGQPF